MAHAVQAGQDFIDAGAFDFAGNGDGGADRRDDNAVAITQL